MSAEVTVTLRDELWERAQLWANHSGSGAEAADFQLPVDQDHRLSELLDGQRETSLPDAERVELSRLMHLYQAGLLRKAIALREAVCRGLREPLDA